MRLIQRCARGGGVSGGNALVTLILPRNCSVGSTERLGQLVVLQTDAALRTIGLDCVSLSREGTVFSQWISSYI